MTEREWRDYLLRNLPQDGLDVHTGRKRDNMILQAPNCDEPMQFGDLRIETETRTIIVEIEGKSSGTIHNLVKYWPYLSGQTLARPSKEFILIHVYGSSYPSHKALWWFMRGRSPSFIVNTKFILFENGEEEKEDIVNEVRKYLA